MSTSAREHANTREHVDWFASNLFGGLGDADIALIGEVARPRQLDQGEGIFSLGEPAQRLYVIESGTVALTLPLQIGEITRALTIEELGSGHACAWSALVPPYRYTRSAHAVTEVHLIEFDRAALQGVFEQHPRIHAAAFTKLSQVVASRLSRVEALFVRKLQKSLAQELGG